MRRTRRSFSFLALSFFVASLAGAAAAQTRLPHQRANNGLNAASSGTFGAYGIPLDDHDGDGWADFAVAAQNWPPFGGAIGRVYVYSGRSAQLVRTFDGIASGALFGLAMGDVGDANGDGVRDLAISSSRLSTNGLNQNGRVQVFSGATGAVLWTVDGLASLNRLGFTVGAVADTTGDGVRELAVGEPGFSDVLLTRGRVLLLNGATGALLGYSQGPIAGQRLGEVLATRPDSGAIYAGDVGSRVYAAPISGVTTATLYQDSPAGSHTKANLALLRTGSGGIRVAIARTSFDSGGFSNNGRIELLDGSSIPILTLDGPANNAGAGSSLASVPDMDGDGFDELVYHWSEGFLMADSHVRVVTQAGALLDEHVLIGAATSVLFATPDVTGDGRSEWFRATASGISLLSQCTLMSRGLDVSSTANDASGFSVTFEIDAGVPNAGLTYVQLYGGSGVEPGSFFPFTGWPLVPLVFDGTTDEAAGLAGSALFPDAAGPLDGLGRATTHMAIPAAIAAQFTGQKLYTTVIAVDFGAGNIPFASNPMSVTFP